MTTVNFRSIGNFEPILGIGVTPSDYLSVSVTSDTAHIGRNVNINQGGTPRYLGIWLNSLNTNTSFNVKSSPDSADQSLYLNAPSGQGIYMRASNVNQATVIGTTFAVTGTFTKASSTFNIPHPLLNNKRLIHSTVEGPRFDLIYRGNKQLLNGYAEVNLDLESGSNGHSMTPGTFVALTRDPIVYLQNNQTFDRVKGEVTGNLLKIYCENGNFNDSIDWMIIAERDDNFIHTDCEIADENGNLTIEPDTPPESDAL